MPTPQYQSESHDQEYSLLALWRVLVIRWRTIAFVVYATVLVALVISLGMPTKYAAQSSLEINPENAGAIDVGRESSPTAESDYAVTLGTQAAVLESDTLALQVIHQLNLESSTALPLIRRDDNSIPLEQSATRRTRILKKFHRNLSVHPLGGTRLLQVQYLDRDPVMAASVVNTLVNDYLEQYFQTRYTATRQSSDWLSKQLADLKNDVETSQQRLVDYQKQTGILGESETNNVVMAKLEEINKQLSAAEANRIVKQAVWQLAKTGDPELISSVAGSSFVQGVGTSANSSQFGLLPTLRAQEAQMKADIAQASARLGPTFPKLRQMQSQLSELQVSIATEVAKIAARAENDYIAAKNAEDMERELFEKQKQEANKLNDSAIQYGILKRELDASREVHEGLLGKLKQAGVLAGLRSSNIVVVDPARPAAKPVSPNYWFNLLFGLGAGIVAGIGYALIQDGTDSLIHTPKDVRRAVGVASLGVVPNASPESPEMVESFRALRTSLLLAGVERPPKVVLVSSALAGEGRTTVSVNLARALALRGRRILLVDADVRNPSVHAQLQGARTEHGLDSLPSKGDVDVSFAENLGGGLQVLAASSLPSLPSELLGSEQMSNLVAGWRENFDHIILDTPPVLSVTDGVVLSRYADAVLMVVRADQTSGDALARACEVLAQSKAPVIGAVLNAMDFNSANYSYYFGHRYGTR